MKAQIVPDYQRHTDFTPEERLKLAGLARVRIDYVIAVKRSKVDHKRLCMANAHPFEIELCLKHIDGLLNYIAFIDQTIFRMYQEHGRLN